MARSLRSHASRGASRIRLLVLLFLTTTLLFGGLWLRELRVGLEQGQAVSGSLQQAAAVRAQLGELQRQSEQRHESLSRANALVGLMAEPRNRHWPLAGEGRGQVFHSAERQAVALFTFDLKEPAADRAYQAWAKPRNGAPASLGMLLEASGGLRSLLATAPAGALENVQVTLEPKTGSPAPTGPVVLSGDAPP